MPADDRRKHCSKGSGDALSGFGSFTFEWTAGTGVTEYTLWVGSSPAGFDLYDSSTGTNQSATVSGLPTDGSNLYVRLYSKIDGAWQYYDYTYIAPGP